MAALKGDDVGAILFGDGSTLLLLYIIEDHDCLRLTDNGSCAGVESTLLERETLIPEAAATCLHHNGVTIEDGLAEVCLDIGNDGDNCLQAEIRREHFTEVLILTNIVIREIAVIVDMTIGIQVVEADLDVYLTVKDGRGFHTLKGEGLRVRDERLKMEVKGDRGAILYLLRMV